MLSEDSLRGGCKRSLERLSMKRSVVADVPSECRLIGALDLAVAFLGGDGDKWRREAGDLGSLEGPGRRGGEGAGGGVGLWESGKLDATGRRLFVSYGREEEVEEGELNFLFYFMSR